MLEKHLIIFACIIGATIVPSVLVQANEDGHSDDFHHKLELLLKGAPEPTKVFDEQMPGFDMRDDKFYYQDDLVDKMFKRSMFTNGLRTLAGQATDAYNWRVKDSSYPFAVGQKSAKPRGVQDDRWDVKDLDNGEVEFFALYHGEGNHFVVNKVRAHLLRRVANELQRLVPALDLSNQGVPAHHDDLVYELHDEVRKSFEKVFHQVDEAIRDSMYETDDSWASATVVMVTKSSIVTASVGEGQVLGYDEAYMIRRLTNYRDDQDAMNVFGARKTRRGTALRPHVEIFSRVKDPMMMLLIESASVAGNIKDYDVLQIISGEINQHKRISQNEQAIYSNSVSRILDRAQKEGSGKRGGPVDYTVALIGLDRDYERMH